MQRIAKQASSKLLPCLALVGFLAGTIGVPVPQRSARVGSNPYPCQGHGCGCKSASGCWQSCCCLTNRQKLAWADEHRVKPPASVVAAAKTETKSSCCALQRESDGDDSAAERNDDWSLEIVLAVQARKCQGMAELWLAIGALPPLPAQVSAASDLIVAGKICALPYSLVGVCDEPQSPPPRA